MMDAKNNWQTYRTSLKDQEAIITVNLEIAEKLDANLHPYVVHFSIPFPLPFDTAAAATQQAQIDRFSQTLLPLMAIGESLFTGYIISQDQVTLYFYTKDSAHFHAVLQQMNLPYVGNIVSQNDPNCDLYYDFLLPSPLEMKLNATAETLALLQHEGEDLSQPHQITHKFQFENWELMNDFIDYYAQQSLFDIKYTERPVQYDGEAFYLVTLQHEAGLDDEAIFNLVEEFEQQAENYHGEYNGWECEMLTVTEKPLH
ncbi:TIGR01619 family protein [Pasteurella testudinis DSM 23072]|uniref:TIGR01619 family protein n=2 Tax=Pasteurella testudinis TaxID=761 RepID=A0A1W1UWT1_9PAST|nr:TIGR01619 family protein [Pasteurella testudinis]SMB85500.1 TIGR01619 family protein [Pasteurella testudinis DSM 23072]SUB51465.1 putative transmembrane protein [Pasteurella testudinis]